MKKIILASMLTGLVAIQSFGQGQVVLGNSSTAKIWTNSVSSTGIGTGTVMPANATQSYTFALLAYYSGSASTSTNAGTTVTATDNSLQPWNDSDWQVVGYGVNGASGRITDVNAFETVANLPSGVYVTMMMVGWNTAVGGSTLASLEQAYGTAAGLLFGYSSTGSILLGNGTTPPNTTAIGTGAGNIPAFTLGVVPVAPEPGTMALAGLGIAGLLALRRKK